jgi:hypothetical protein
LNVNSSVDKARVRAVVRIGQIARFARKMLAIDGLAVRAQRNEKKKKDFFFFFFFFFFYNTETEHCFLPLLGVVSLHNRPNNIRRRHFLFVFFFVCVQKKKKKKKKKKIDKKKTWQKTK